MKAHAENNARSIRPRCVGLSLLFGVSAILLSSTFLNAQTKWQSVDTVWTNPSNWSDGVPSDTSSVVISDGQPDAYVPPPSGSDTACTGDLTINHVGLLRFVSSSASYGILKICGILKLLQNASIDLGGGKIVFKDNVSLQGTGLFRADSGTMTFEGANWNVNAGASFVPGTSTLILEGSGNQTITGNVTFYNLVIKTSGTVTIDGSVCVQADLTVDSGATVVVASGDSLTVQGTLVNNGSITGGGTLPLPVEMVSITVADARDGVELRWVTATEVNNFGFEIQRSSISQSTSGWTTLGFVKGGGTTSSLRTYAFVDRNPAAGLYAYRVKQINTDGTFTFSKSTQLEVAAVPKMFTLSQNFPNPFNPSTEIMFSVATAGKTVVEVYNLIGQRVDVLFDRVAEAGQHYLLTFTGTSLPSGLYFVKLQSGDLVATKKMTLLK
jgi:hypothetical protein